MQRTSPSQATHFQRHLPRRLALCSALALAFAAPVSPASGATVIELDPQQRHLIATPLDTDLGSLLGDVVYQGLGVLSKTGPGTVSWGAHSATFALQAGSWIDVAAGRFVGGSSANENWTRNLSGLRVAAGAVFEGVEANVRVDALTGSGRIRSGFTDGGWRAGYETFTFGVANGSGSFAGALMDGNSPGHFTKAGNGTQVLTGSSSYTGGTRVAGGTLAIGDGGSSGAILGPVRVDAGATLAFNRADEHSFAGTVQGEGRLLKQGGGNLLLSQSVNLQQGIDIQAGTLTLQGSGLTLQGPIRNDGVLVLRNSDSYAPLLLDGPLRGTGVLRISTGAVHALGQLAPGGGTQIANDARLVMLPGSALQGPLLFDTSTSSILEVTPGTELALRDGISNLGFAGGTIDHQGTSLALSGSVKFRYLQLTQPDPSLPAPKLLLGELDKPSHIDIAAIYLGNGSQVDIAGRQTVVGSAGSPNNLRLDRSDPATPATVTVRDGARMFVSSASIEQGGIWQLRDAGTSVKVSGNAKVSDGSAIRLSSGAQMDVAALLHLTRGSSVSVEGERTSLSVNNLNTGFNSINVSAGATLQTAQASLSGTVLSLSGAGTRWVNDATIKLDINGSQLQLLDGALLRANALVDTDGESRLLLDGGVLELAQASSIGALDWRSGRVSLGLDSHLGQGLLAANLALADGRELSVQGTLSVGAGQSLQLGQGGSLQAERLLLTGGSFEALSGADFRSVLDWQQGTLTLRGAAQLGQGLASLPALDAKRSLRVLGTLGSHAGGPGLTLLNGGKVEVHGGLQLDGAIEIAAGADLLLAEGSASRISGGLSSDGLLTLRQGTLTLSNSNQLARLNLGSNSELRVTGAGSQTQLRDLLLSGDASGSRISVLDGARLEGPQNFKLTGASGVPNTDAPLLHIAGSGSRFDAQVQSYQGARVLVENGGSLRATELTLLPQASLRVQGPGSFVDVANLHLHARSSIELLSGGALRSGSLELQTGAELVLNGGSLQLDRPGASFTAGLRWQQGLLSLGADTALNQGLLAADLVLDSGRALAIKGQLQIQQGQSLLLGVGGRLQAERLMLAGGSLSAAPDATFDGRLDWQSGSLNLLSDARQGQGLLAMIPASLGGEHSLRVQGVLTLDAAAPLAGC
ncbi:autotransporter-associated beta strand repeat-containing protein [Roseateles cavernae]|uniref:autotransporter-associated beta strand repeat-containing protein n=1 Tax=Roseateles cavernae TaxID=3153578 RepID=UPI0032E44453